MSALTFQNQTPYIAQYLVYKGEQVVARLPGVAPGATLRVPHDKWLALDSIVADLF